MTLPSTLLPKVKQYLYQAQDETHYLRLSLALAITNHLLVPNHEQFGSSTNGAFSLKSVSPGSSLRSNPFATSSFAAGSLSTTTPQQTIVEVQGMLWSLYEDKLIVRCEEARVDVVEVYATFHRANPIMYPKTHRDPAPYKERYGVLLDDAPRLKMIHVLPDDSVTHLEEADMIELSRKNSGLFQSSAVSSSSDIGNLSTQKSRAQALKSFQKFKTSNQKSGGGSGGGGGGSHAYRKEDLLLLGVVRQGAEQYDISCCSEDIVNQSPLLRDMFHGSKDYVAGGARRVVLSEKDQMWATIPDMSNVFGSDNLHRFKNFCEAPGMLAALVDLHERLGYKETQATDEWNTFVDSAFEKRDEQLRLVETLCTNTVTAMRGKLQQSLDADVQSIRELYSSHMDQEEKKLRRYFEDQRVNIELFYEREVQSLDVLRLAVDAHEPESISELRRELTALGELTMDTYGSKHLPRLLMLSDVLMCNELRSQCLKLIAAEVGKYYALPELSSQLLRANTLRELLTLVPDSELHRLHRLVKAKSSSGGYRGLPLEIVEAERSERGNARTQELMRKQLDEVQDLSRRVNLQLVRLKQQQAINVLSPSDAAVAAAAVAASATNHTSTSSSTAVGSGVGDRIMQAVRLANQHARGHTQPKTQSDLKKGVTEEDAYIGWRELLQDALGDKLQQAGGPHNVSVIRIPKGLEGVCTLLHHRRGFDVKQAFRQVTVEAQGCVTVGESCAMLYWEARVIFVDSGTRFPLNVWVGMDPVASSMNHMQVNRLRATLAKERDDSVTANVVSAERVAKETAKANPVVGPTIASMSTAAAPATALIRNFFALSSLNASALTAADRAVGVTPVNVASHDNPAFPLHGFSWSSDGLIYTEGVPFDIRTTYDTGDTIGIAFHTMTGEVQLYKNSERIECNDKSVAWPRLRPGVTYQPVISCYSNALPSLSSVAQGAGSVLSHQVVRADEDTVLVSHTGGVVPKARVLLELDGRCRVMPSGTVAFARGATPTLFLQRTATSTENQSHLGVKI